MRILIFASLFFIFFFLFSSVVNAGRGCCSYHGGQSYCDTTVGRWVCNDGRYSPTCRCYLEPPPLIISETPTSKPIQPVLSDQTSNKWCGAGSWFTSKEEATQSLTTFVEEVLFLGGVIIAGIWIGWKQLRKP